MSAAIGPSSNSSHFYTELLPPMKNFVSECSSYTTNKTNGQSNTLFCGAGSSDDDDVFDVRPIVNVIEASESNRQDIRPVSTSPEPQEDLTILEKLIKSHAIWYLPQIERLAAVHILRNQSSGIFLVRHSSQANAMALSVKLSKAFVPSETAGSDVEHFLIEQTSNGVRLEGSAYFFPALPMLILHYFDCNELPVHLKLPEDVMNCKTRQELLSVSLLGQDFWALSENNSNPSLPPQTQMGKKVNKSCSTSSPPCGTKDRRVRSKSSSTHPRYEISRPDPNSINIFDATDSNKKISSGQSAAGSIPYIDEMSTSDGSTKSTRKPFTRFESQTLQHCKPSTDNPTGNNKPDRKFSWRSIFESSPITHPPSHIPIAKTGGAKRSLSTSSPSCQKIDNPSSSTGTVVWYRGLGGEKKPSSPDLFLSEPNKYVSGVNNFKTTSDPFSESETVPKLSTGADFALEEPAQQYLTSFKPKEQSVIKESATLQRNARSTFPNKSNLKSSVSFNFYGELEKLDSSSQVKNQLVEMRRQRIENMLKQQKEQQAQKHSTSQQGKATVYRSKRDGSPHFLARRENSLDSKAKSKFGQFLKFRKKPAQQQTKVTNEKSQTKANKQSHRLSAPNLLESTIAMQNKNLPQIIAELKRKQLAFCDNAEKSNKSSLHTINEGLVTPLSTRKQKNLTKDVKRRLSKSADDIVHDDVLENGLESFYDDDTKNGGHHDHDLGVKVEEFEDMSEETKKSLQQNIFRSLRHKTQRKPKLVLDPASDTSDYGLLLQTCQSFNAKHGRLSQNMNSGSSGEEKRFSCDSKQKRETRNDDVDDCKSVVSVAGTLFSEPWDSSNWENLLDATGDQKGRKSTGKRESEGSKVARISFPDQSICSITNPDPQQLVESEPCRKDTSANIVGRSNFFVNSARWEQFSKQVPPSSSCSTITSNNLEIPIDTNGARKLVPVKLTNNYLDEKFAALTNQNLMDNADQNVQSSDDSEKFVLAPVSAPARFRESQNKHRPSANPSHRIQQCLENLAADLGNFFGTQIKNFIDCTLQAREADPNVVLGNVRQFMNGIKNYLVKQGERDLHDLIEHERSKLRANEFLNIDAILEGALQKILLQRLKSHLYHVLIKDSSRSGTLNLISSNFALLRSKVPEDFGIRNYNHDDVLSDKVRNFLRKMQNQYSPLKKLENLLQALSLAYQMSQNDDEVEAESLSISHHSIRSGVTTASAAQNLPCSDDLLNWFVFVLSRYSVVGCEVESSYMRGLLHPSLLSGEASFYLATFATAVHVLKHLDLLPKKLLNCNSLGRRLAGQNNNDDSSECLLKVAIPNENVGSISYQAFPLAPQLTVAKFCRMVAHRCGVTNPEDYGLYLLVDGFETCLLPSECPYLVNEQLQMAGAARMFAYKRHEAKIAWPKIAMSP